MINSVMGQGLSGMQQSGRKMQEAAHEIARTGQPAEGGGRLGQGSASEANSDGFGGLATNSVEMTRQEHIFTASAKVVSVADKAIGTLLDMKA